MVCHRCIQTLGPCEHKSLLGSQVVIAAVFDFPAAAASARLSDHSNFSELDITITYEKLQPLLTKLDPNAQVDS